jgi:uncharacterized protein YutE (UPF0331/DUF86 family)
VERNLEIAAQCCIDISNRIISIERIQKPKDYHEAILRIGEIGVLPMKFALKMAPIAGFRNILVHEYMSVDWDEVYRRLQGLDDIFQFAEYIRQWLHKKDAQDSNHSEIA